METIWFKVSIELEDGIVFSIYTEGREDEEDLILDYMYQKYWEQQPDISKYNIVIANRICDAVQKVINEYYKDRVTSILAFRAIDYVEIYN